VQLNPEDVLHIPGLGFNGIMGYSPIALEKNAIGLGIAAEEYGSKFFQNGARPSGILTHPNTIRAPENMNLIPEEEGGNTYLCNGNLIPVGLASISMVASAVSTLEDEPPAEDTPTEQAS
jgi:phage portal protein BeeE